MEEAAFPPRVNPYAARGRICREIFLNFYSPTVKMELERETKKQEEEEEEEIQNVRE